MDVYGLIGKKLGHSFSPAYFNNKFENENIDAVYKLFEIASIEAFPALIDHSDGLVGFNVTIPYKEHIIPFLDEVDPVANLIGSVNTIKVDRNKNIPHLKGYNTDVIGFEKTLLKLISGRQVDNALILGTGGSAKTVSYVLDKLDIAHRFVSRTPGPKEDLSYKEIRREIISSNQLIINTTPVGMFPESDQKPDIPYQALSPNHALYDLIYNPEETRFLKLGKEKGAAVMSGGEMLKIQADEAWRIWNA